MRCLFCDLYTELGRIDHRIDSGVATIAQRALSMGYAFGQRSMQRVPLGTCLMHGQMLSAMDRVVVATLTGDAPLGAGGRQTPSEAGGARVLPLARHARHPAGLGADPFPSTSPPLPSQPSPTGAKRPPQEVNAERAFLENYPLPHRPGCLCIVCVRSRA